MKNQVKVGVGIFVFKNGKFLMGKRKGSHGEDTWSIPGGHLEFGESYEETSKREVLEETGIYINNIKFGAITNDIFKKENKHYITIWTTSDYESGNEEVTEPDKFIELGWFDFNSLPTPLFYPWNQLLKSEFIDKIKNYKNIKQNAK